MQRAHLIVSEDADMLIFSFGHADAFGGVVVEHAFCNAPVQEVQQAVEYALVRGNARVTTPAGEIVVDLTDLWKSMNDYKTKQLIDLVDYQSLIALRASNHSTLIPPLPEREVYRSICDETGQIDSVRLDQVIRDYLYHFRPVQ